MSGNSAWNRLRGAIRRHFMPRRHSGLLVATIAVFAARPLLGNNYLTLISYSIAVMVVLVLGLYTIQVDELVGEQ